MDERTGRLPPEPSRGAGEAAASLADATRRPSPGLWLVLGVFLTIQAVLLAITLVGLELIDGTRAYVAGEGYYAKAQKSAVIALQRYIVTEQPGHYDRFRAEIAGPLGAGTARRALESEPADLDAARLGFLRANTHPDDIPTVIWLTQAFGPTDLFAPARQIWRRADEDIAALSELGGRIREAVAADGLTRAERHAFLDRAEALDRALSRQERAFSRYVGRVARGLKTGLFWTLITTSALLWTGAGWWAHRVFRRVTQTQTALRASEARFRDVAETAGDWIAETDAAGRVSFVSDRLAEVSGVPTAGLIGRPVEEIARPVDARTAARVRNAIAARRPIKDVEHRLAAATGAGAGRRVRISAKPVFDDAGVYRGYRGAARDVTEEIEAREALDHQRRILETTFEYMDQGISVVDSELRAIAFNQRFLELLDFPTDRFRVGASFAAFIRYNAERGEYGAGDVEALTAERVAAARRFEPHLFERERPDGTVLEIRGRPLPDGGFVTTYTDITQRIETESALREAAAEAERANRAKDEFLANMSHDLRTPLNAIIGFADVMQSEAMGPLSDRYREYCADIRASGQHLLTLISDLLDLSKIEAGRLELSTARFDLAELAGEADRLLAGAAREHGVAIDNRIAGPMPVEADRSRMLQILTNLLGNAVKYNRTGGSAVLEAERDANALEIRVIDTGPGMTDTDIPLALSKFGRLPRDAGGGDTGTGLGLPIVKHLVEMHGGTLALEATPGEGTRATVRLPREVLVAAPGAG